MSDRASCLVRKIDAIASLTSCSQKRLRHLLRCVQNLNSSSSYIPASCRSIWFKIRHIQSASHQHKKYHVVSYNVNTSQVYQLSWSGIWWSLHAINEYQNRLYSGQNRPCKGIETMRPQQTLDKKYGLDACLTIVSTAREPLPSRAARAQPAKKAGS
jgi:hypothetical protein